MGTRAEVLKMMKDAPMVVEPFKPEDDPDVDIVLSFRSQIVGGDERGGDYGFMNSVNSWILL